MHFKTYDDLSGYLDRLGMFRMDLTLDRVRVFGRKFGKPGFALAHVVGTNGKGSTSAFLAELAMTHDLNVGLYSSPHFVSPRERILVNGQMLGREEWVDLGNRLMDMIAGSDLTYFEFLTCLSFLAFEEHGVDLAVMEAGMGGRYDAVCVFEPDLTLFTPIALDHQKFLGDTLSDIASDKAHALRPGGIGIHAPQDPEALKQLTQRAKDIRATLGSASKDLQHYIRDTSLGLSGPHQEMNAALALAGWEHLAVKLERESEQEKCKLALARTFVPGRMQVVKGDPCLILDGAHNVHSMQALEVGLKAMELEPDCMIFSCMKDKNLSEILPILERLGSGPVLVPDIPDCERAMQPSVLAGRIGSRAEAVADMADGLSRTAGCKTILVCGSLYLLAEFYKLRPHLLMPPR